MATDFNNGGKTILSSGGFQPSIKNTPIDARTRVNLKADIDSIPNPFVGMHIIVLQDESNNDEMTEYIVKSLKANSLGVAEAKVDKVVLVKDFLGLSNQETNEEDLSLYALKTELPTKTSDLTNDSDYATNSSVDTKIANAQLGSGSVDLTDLQTKTDETLSTTDKTVVGAINELFQSVSSGKRLIASAITDKGVMTSENDSFQNMANNIKSISGGSSYIQGRQLVWHDEFDETEINSNYWGYELGKIRNGELQTYTNSSNNSYIEDGCLVLRALKDNTGNWTSASMFTNDKFEYQYGRWEAKIKTPNVIGSFPAFWTLGAGQFHNGTASVGEPWKTAGEIDVMEHIPGNATKTIHGTWFNSKRQCSAYTSDVRLEMDMNEFHVYAVEWKKDVIEWYVDNTLILQYPTHESMFDHPHYLLVNLAVGASGGDPEETCSEMKMYIDYVRVYAPENIYSELSISQQDIQIETIGGTYQLYPVFDAYMGDRTVFWESDNERVATVIGGKVTAKSEGVCTITVMQKDGSYAKCHVTVGSNNISLSSISHENITINCENNIDLSPVFTPSDTTDTRIKYYVSNENIASISNGVLTANNIVGTTNVAIEHIRTGLKRIFTATTNSSSVVDKYITLLDFDTYIDGTYIEKLEIDTKSNGKHYIEEHNDHIVFEEYGALNNTNLIIKPKNDIVFDNDKYIFEIECMYNYNYGYHPNNNNLRITIGKDGTGVDAYLYINKNMTINSSTISSNFVTNEKAKIKFIVDFSENTYEFIYNDSSLSTGSLKSGLTQSYPRIIVASGILKLFKVNVSKVTKSDSSTGSETVELNSIQLSESSITLNKDESVQLTYTLNPTNTTQTNITWSSENDAIATVNNGNVTGISAGSTNVVCSSVDNPTISVLCSVTVNDNTVVEPDPEPIASAVNFIEKGYINDSGTVVNNEEFLSDYIEITSPNKYLFIRKATSIEMLRCSEFDADKTFIKRSYTSAKKLSATLDDTTSYVRIGFKDSSISDISEATDYFNNNYKFLYNLQDFNISTGDIDYQTGLDKNGDFYRTDYIEVTSSSLDLTYADLSNVNASLDFVVRYYDANKNFLTSSSSITEYGNITLDSNVKFIRIRFNRASKPAMLMNGISYLLKIQ